MRAKGGVEKKKEGGGLVRGLGSVGTEEGRTSY